MNLALKFPLGDVSYGVPGWVPWTVAGLIIAIVLVAIFCFETAWENDK